MLWARIGAYGNLRRMRSRMMAAFERATRHFANALLRVLLSRPIFCHRPRFAPTFSRAILELG